jgi:hypothetical protein
MPRLRLLTPAVFIAAILALAACGGTTPLAPIQGAANSDRGMSRPADLAIGQAGDPAFADNDAVLRPPPTERPASVAPTQPPIKVVSDTLPDVTSEFMSRGSGVVVTSGAQFFARGSNNINCRITDAATLGCSWDGDPNSTYSIYASAVRVVDPDTGKSLEAFKYANAAGTLVFYTMTITIPNPTTEHKFGIVVFSGEKGFTLGCITLSTLCSGGASKR